MRGHNGKLWRKEKIQKIIINFLLPSLYYSTHYYFSTLQYDFHPEKKTHKCEWPQLNGPRRRAASP